MSAFNSRSPNRRFIYSLIILFFALITTILLISDSVYLRSDNSTSSLVSITTTIDVETDDREFQKYACSSHRVNQQLLSFYNNTPNYISWTPSNITKLRPGQPFCVRVLIKAGLNINSTSTDPTFYPIPGYDIDSIEIHARGNNIFIPFDIYATGDHLYSVHNSTEFYRVYETDIRLFDADEYKITGVIEYVNANWNLDPLTEKGQYLDWTLFNDTSVLVRIISEPDDSERLFADDEFIPLTEFDKMPICDNGNHPGRWIPKNLLPSEYKEHLPPVLGSEKELVWVPYTCRYKPYSSDEFAQCVSNRYPKGIQWYGDSNSRRSVKKLASKNTWCGYPMSEDMRRTCSCEDYHDKSVAEYFTSVDSCHFEWEGGKNVSIKLDFLGGLTAGQCRKKPSDGVEEMVREITGYNKTTNTSSPTGRLEQNSLLLFGIVNWDAARFAVNTYQDELKRVVDLFISLYNNVKTGAAPPFILRSGQFFCCTQPIGFRLFSRKRISAFNDILFNAFQQKDLPFDRVGVWDVFGLSRMRDRRDLVKQFTSCPSSHAVSEMVEIENQLLMNMMCNGNLK